MKALFLSLALMTAPALQQVAQAAVFPAQMGGPFGGIQAELSIVAPTANGFRATIRSQECPWATLRSTGAMENPYAFGTQYYPAEFTYCVKDVFGKLYLNKGSRAHVYVARDAAGNITAVRVRSGSRFGTSLFTE